MQQTVLAGKNLNEATVRHDGTHGSLVNLTHFGYCHDSLDLAESSVDAVLVGRTNLHFAHTVNLVDGDGSTGVFLHLLDDLTARAYHSTDKLLRYLYLHDARHLRLHVLARCADGVSEFAEDVFASGLSLHEGLFKYLEAQSVALDIHLCSCESVLRTSGLEVHVAKVVLVAENVAKHSILVLARVLYQTHCDTAHGLLHGHTSVHQGECTGAYSGH